MTKLGYYVIFLLRRLIFVAIPTFVHSMDFMQLQLLIFFSSLYIISYSGSQPHNTTRRNVLESFNEFMIMVSCYHLVCFSKFNLDIESQFTMGYSYIGVIMIVVFVNLFNMGHDQVKACMRNRRQRKVDKVQSEGLAKFRQIQKMIEPALKDKRVKLLD